MESIRKLLENGYTVLGMPQSLYYRNEKLMVQDSEKLRKIVFGALKLQTEDITVSKSKLILCWRQKDSFDLANQLYPFADNRLVPDIAFSVGPLLGTEKFTSIPLSKSQPKKVDILLLLRADKESVVSANRNLKFIGDLLRSTSADNKPNNASNITFKIVDWNDRKNTFQLNSATKMKDLEFDMPIRIASASSLLSSGKVIISDRLHGSIYSFLMHKPHVYIDQVSKKVSLTREVAFGVDEKCRDGQKLGYRAASDLEDAVRKAVVLLGNLG